MTDEEAAPHARRASAESGPMSDAPPYHGDNGAPLAA